MSTHAPNEQEDLPILTDIVASGKPIAANPPALPVADGDAAQYAKVPRMPIQRSSINFLQPLKRQPPRKRHALPSAAFQEESAPLITAPAPTPPSGETRIVHVPFQAKTPRFDHHDDAANPLLMGLFDENPARDLERQILRLAEERAKRRAEQVVAEQWQKMQQTLMHEILKTVPEVVAAQLSAKQEQILHHAMQTMTKPVDETTTTAEPVPKLAAWVRQEPTAVYQPAPAPIHQETRIVEDLPPTPAIRESAAPQSKWAASRVG